MTVIFGVVGLIILQVNEESIIAPLGLTDAERSRWALVPMMILLLGFVWLLAVSTDGGRRNARQDRMIDGNWRSTTPEALERVAKREAKAAKRAASAGQPQEGTRDEPD